MSPTNLLSMELEIHFLLSIAFLLLLRCSMASSAMEATSPDINTDQSALLALKSHIQTDSNNTLANNWTVTTSVCNWVGVTCGTRHQRVAALNLSYMGLVGAIPPHIGNLSFLVELNLRNNSFHGQLPVQLAALRRLKFLNFGFNRFEGEIPSWLGSLPKLQILKLYGNNFSGSIPASIFNISSLQMVSLPYNRLSGSIPREIGNSKKLKTLLLDQNNLEEIPKEIGDIQLEDFSVQFNALKGPLPLFLFNMSSLYSLGLSQNYLTGSLPDDLCQHLPALQALRLSNNQLVGPIPSKLSHCRKLQLLALAYNNFTGRIPKAIANLTQLTDLYLGANSLTGPITNEMGDLYNLETFSLSINQLTGPIPFRIFNMSSLKYLELNQNQLSGRLPDIWGPNLEELYVASNYLTGSIPESISNASSLTVLEIANNSFSGFIPISLSYLTNLHMFVSWDNNLTLGKTSETNILHHLSNLKYLTMFVLSDNPLDSILPSSIGNWSSSLQYVYLNVCKLRGKIPTDIGNLSSLVTLSLSGNSLDGPIPTSIQRLSSLQGLYLESNSLQGSIPNELCHLNSLFELYLSSNKLSGSIPTCFGNLGNLRYLLVDSNEFVGIHSNFWNLVDILKINFSSNSFSGSLPPEIGKLKAVTSLDFSYNQLSNNIPSTIGQLQTLAQLNLSHNNFQGPVPDSFGKLLSLEFMDLSSNNLSGVLPKSLEGLLHLKHLNVSSNKLEGEIPTGGPFKTFSAQSFMSNKALCGAPVKPCKSLSLPHSKKIKKKILKYVLPAILSATLILGVLFWLTQLRKRSKKSASEDSILHRDWKRVSYHELLRATNGLGKDNLLGSGAFGSVYKGALSNGMTVAIKVFNLQQEGAFKSFDVECEVLRNVRHRNLVKIISSCSNQTDFKALILEYMPRGSLDKLLYDNEFCLDILQRLNIMIDVASAVEYLHYDCSIPIVHCDLKPSNVLLDEDMVAHVTDFGIARLLTGNNSLTHTINLATIGYMAPEYGFEGVVSRRGDVYSYGILLMETFTRRKPTDEMFGGEMSLKQWVANSFSNEVTEVIDTNLLKVEEENYPINKDSVSSILKLALSCAAETPEERNNIKNIVTELMKIKKIYLEAMMKN